MASELRKTGISVVGDVPWGTHFCHFYETKQDLLDTLVPYFKAGLESDEFCLWVVSDSDLITVEEAKGALAQAVPDLDRHLSNENIEILNGRDWYLEENVFNLERVTKAWDAKLKRALARGYEGMRVSGDTFWLAEKDWKDFHVYENQLNKSIAGQRMNVLCTYPLMKSGATEVLDVMQVHQFAIARRQGEWEVIESTEPIQAKAEIKRLNKELQRVLDRTPERPAILRYGVAVLSVIVALISLLLMDTNLQAAAHVSLFLCALIFSTWFGGIRPGLLAIVLSILAFAYVLPPFNSLAVEITHLPRLILFALLAIFVASLTAAQHSKTASLRRARALLEDTVQELRRTNVALRAEIAERKHAETLLYAKEQEFRAIVENAPDQIIRYDREFRRAYVNPAVARAYGLPREALIGKPIGSVIEDTGLDVKEDELTQLRQQIANVFDTGQSYEYELNWPLPTGRRYFSVRLFPELDLNGSVANVLGISQDITERKQAEEALDERLRFETLLTELSAAFANLKTNEVDREIDKWLQTLAGFLGVDRASFLQFEEDWTTLYRSHSYTVPGIEPLPPPPIVLKDQFPWITEQLRRGVTVKWSRIPDDMAEEATKEKEYAARLGVKSGLNIPVRMGGLVICAITFTSIETYRDWPDSMVARLRLVGEIFAAAIERKRAEEALREAEQKYRDIFENAGEGIFQSTPDGRYIAANPALARMYGFASPEELIHGRQDISLQVYVDPTRREEFKHQLEEQSVVRGFELEVFRKDGSRLWISVNARAVRDEQGAIQYYEGTAEDITERKAAEEKLKATSEQLLALSARLQSAREEEGIRIAREIHDELGSALTALRWGLDEIREMLSTAMPETEVGKVQEKLATLTNLIDTTFEIVRRVSSELRPGIVDDAGLVAAIVWAAKGFEARTGITCRFESPVEDVHVSREQSTAIFRIFQEALTNIMRHAEATRVEITIKEAADEFVMTITDNGKGITEQQQSGVETLGIIGMRERAYLIGGQFSITSGESRGTVVTVRVPIGGGEAGRKMTR
jgi:PAS domain S-box-containing protein